MNVATGDLIFFRKPLSGKNDIIPSLIRFGEALPYWLTFQKAPEWIPHHVEMVDLERGTYHSWGAHVGVGFVPIPLGKRIEGLTEGRDYRIVHLDSWGHRASIDQALKLMHGTPYEKVLDVLKTWRNANASKGSKRMFCSEALARVLSFAGLDWIDHVDFNNIKPLELYLIAEHYTR